MKNHQRVTSTLTLKCVAGTLKICKKRSGVELLTSTVCVCAPFGSSSKTDTDHDSYGRVQSGGQGIRTIPAPGKSHVSIYVSIRNTGMYGPRSRSK